jgi:hypothetical protein
MSKTPNGFVIHGALQPAYKYEETNLFLSNLWVIFTFLSAAFLIYLNIRFIKWLKHKIKENNAQTVEQQ